MQVRVARLVTNKSSKSTARMNTTTGGNKQYKYCMGCSAQIARLNSTIIELKKRSTAVFALTYLADIVDGLSSGLSVETRMEYQY